jgi:hypothetical protein
MTFGSAKRSEGIPPGLAWLTVFIPALSYFLATRFSSLQHDSLGTVVTTHASIALNTVFYLKQNELQYPLVLIDDSYHDVVASLWRHDADLERGYLLLSQSHGNGRIWRWERGGGPIPIGKTLAMDPSGCRSKPCISENSGSGGLAVDFFKHDNYRQGCLVVAEWGEGRIVKLEEGTGARTPLVINVPDACKHASARPRRVERPKSMLYTPTGDLLFMESTTSSCSTVMRLYQAVHVPPLESAMTSRVAHKWNETHHDHSIDVLYRETNLGSMALDSKGEGLYVSVKRSDDNVLLVYLPLLEDDDDDDEKETSQVSDTRMGLLYDAAIVKFNLTDADVHEAPQAMAVDESGNVFLAISSGLLVLNEEMEILGKLDTPTPITSLTLGDDKFLYITTSTQLLRIRVRQGPPKLPTNLVKRSNYFVK